MAPGWQLWHSGMLDCSGSRPGLQWPYGRLDWLKGLGLQWLQEGLDGSGSKGLDCSGSRGLDCSGSSGAWAAVAPSAWTAMA